MKWKRNSAKGRMWLGTCATCRALCDTLETLFVLVLALIVFCLAYLTTLEEIPCPDFVIRQIESKLELRGISMRMDSIRLYTDGQILVESPTIFSNDLGSALGSADLALIKISLPLLVFGEVQIERIGVSNGTFVAPPMLSASGVAEKLVHGIDFEIEPGKRVWALNYARLRYANFKAFAYGEIGNHLLDVKNKGPSLSIREQIVKIVPQLAKNQKYTRLANNPNASIRLFLNEPGDQGIDIRLNAEAAAYEMTHSVAATHLSIQATEKSGISLAAKLSGISTLQNISASRIEFLANWPQHPSKHDWQPRQVQLALNSVSKESVQVTPTILLDARTSVQGPLQATFDIALAERALGGHAVVDLTTQSGSINLSGLVGKSITQIASTFVPQDLTPFAQFEIPPYFDLTATFDSFKKRPDLTARFSTAALTSKQALFDRAKGTASVIGPQIRVDDIWISSRTQQGLIDIAYNLESLERRFLIEGHFNPKNLDSWFQPWWTEFWDNFQFPQQGMYGLMDSYGIFLQPQTIRITGTGQGAGLGIRDYPMENLWMKYNIYQHHFDLYDIDLERTEGTVKGDTRIAIASDPKDDKFKLTAIWVDAASSIDLSIAPDMLHEIRQATAEILDPYQYQIPPTVTAQSSSLMENGVFTNDINLVIETENPLTVFDFPFDTVFSEVHVDNELISISNGRGGVGGGTLTLEADIVDDAITVETQLEKADFGKTLFATSTYFAAKDEEERAAAIAAGTPLPPEDPEEAFDINELLEYGGFLDANFTGKGIVGDSLSYEGDGAFKVYEANLKELQMFGMLSTLLENTPLRVTTLKFDEAMGTFVAKKRFVEFPEPTISGPIAVIKSSGKYDLEKDNLDFRAKLFPFRKSSFPPFAIIGFVASPASHLLEVQLSGPLKEPTWSLFKQTESPATVSPPATSE